MGMYAADAYVRVGCTEATMRLTFKLCATTTGRRDSGSKDAAGRHGQTGRESRGQRLR